LLAPAPRTVMCCVWGFSSGSCAARRGGLRRAQHCGWSVVFVLVPAPRAELG
ncbi:hypothetical protein A2U01_0077436, partial [Trifolium medium]|nr:hypothetical protein [Trifolium medium]